MGAGRFNGCSNSHVKYAGGVIKTTIVSFLSQNYIVLGSDSLATYPRLVLGKRVPAFHMHHVEKIFRFGSSFGVSLTGLPRIGDQSVETLLYEFSKSPLEQLLASNWTLKTIADGLRQYLRERYEAENETSRLKLLLNGFKPGDDGEPYRPAVANIWVSDPGNFTIPEFGGFNTNNPPKPRPSVTVSREPNIYYAGQTREIEKLRLRMTGEYTEEAQEKLDELREEDVEQFNDHLVAQLDKYRRRYFPHVRSIRPNLLDIDSMSDWGFIYELADSGYLDFDFAHMSIQTAIDFVDFLINVQIKMDEFSKRPVNVGGDVQIALIQRQGFTWISKREWRHGENVVKRGD